MVTKDEIWAQIVTKMKDYADFLVKAASNDSGSVEYATYVQNACTNALKNADTKTNEDVQTISASIRGLNRYYSEFYWGSDTDKTAEKYLHDLAVLSVNLLNLYGF